MPICIPASIAMHHGDPSAYAVGQEDHAYLTSNDGKTASVLTIVLPQFVRRRLTPLRSFRDMASNYIRPTGHGRALSVSSIASSSTESILAPPPYTEEPLELDEDDEDGIYASAPSSRPSSSSNASPLTAAPLRQSSAQTSEDLVRLKFANQGLLLVAQSTQELRNNPSANNDYQRRLYLDGIAYLLRALPEELSETERASLQAALPADLREQTERITENEEPLPIRHQSGLSVLVSLVVFWSFLAFAATLPYVRAAMQAIYAFERKHKLGERGFHKSLGLAQITYKQLVSLLFAIWMFNDGMVGKLTTELSMWCAQHVSQGIRDGLKDAAAALRRTQE